MSKRRANLSRKEIAKTLLMDAQTAARLTRAAYLLGLPANSFIQMALHRAFEQFGEIAFEMVEEAARQYVNLKTGLFRQAARKRYAVPAGPWDLVVLQKGIRQVRFLNPSHREALNEVAHALERRTPRTWGRLRFTGCQDQKYLAELGLRITGKIDMKALHNILARHFIDQVQPQVEQWVNLPQLQARVEQSITGISKELTLSYAREEPVLKAGLKRLRAGKSVSHEFLRYLRENVPSQHKRWHRTVPEAQVRWVERRIELCSERRGLLNTQRKRLNDRLERVKRHPRFWFNPSNLQRWLDQNGSEPGAPARNP